MNRAVNLQVGEPIFNLENEKLGDRQRHFVRNGYGEVYVALELGQPEWRKLKPDTYNADIVVRVKLAK